MHSERETFRTNPAPPRPAQHVRLARLTNSPAGGRRSLPLPTHIPAHLFRAFYFDVSCGIALMLGTWGYELGDERSMRCLRIGRPERVGLAKWLVGGISS